MGTTNAGKERLIEIDRTQFHLTSVISTHIPDVGDEYREEIKKARKDLCDLIRKERCAPLMLLLAWHDAGTFDSITLTGGANGSIRNEKELNHDCNKGLKPALRFCKEIKSKHPLISYADIIQLAGVCAVEVSGGPWIDLIPGRKDSSKSPKEGRLPNPTKVLKLTAGSIHMMEVFTRMGFYTREIVCLLGPYILANAHACRSDFDGFWATLPFKLDNSYFVELLKREREGLLNFPMDLALLEDYRFSPDVCRYAKDIFQTPTGLPPPRSHEHAIILKDGTTPVSVPSYRYLQVQKDEVERLVQEMLPARLKTYPSWTQRTLNSYQQA